MNRTILRLGLAVQLVSCGVACGLSGTYDDRAAACDEGCGGDGPCPDDCAPAVPAGWEPLLLWLGGEADDPGCPEVAPATIHVGHADLDEDPFPCGACSCGPSHCMFPQVVIGSSVYACPNLLPEATLTTFYTPEGWDGSCVNTGPMVGQVFPSFYIGPPVLSACNATQAAVPSPGAPWKTLGRACGGAGPLDPCDDPGRPCLRDPLPPAKGFVRCVRSFIGEDQACPAGYEDEHVLHGGVDDTRACAPCECGPPSGGMCHLYTFVHDGLDCTSFAFKLLNHTVTSAVCATPDVRIQSVTCRNVVTAPASCTPSGGSPVGRATPIEPETFCCERIVETEE